MKELTDAWLEAVGRGEIDVEWNAEVCNYLKHAGRLRYLLSAPHTPDKVTLFVKCVQNWNISAAQAANIFGVLDKVQKCLVLRRMDEATKQRLGFNELPLEQALERADPLRYWDTVSAWNNDTNSIAICKDGVCVVTRRWSESQQRHLQVTHRIALPAVERFAAEYALWTIEEWSIPGILAPTFQQDEVMVKFWTQLAGIASRLAEQESRP